MPRSAGLEAQLVDMPTLQFQRSKMRHSRGHQANRPEAIARRNAAADERRMALPPPMYPIDVQPGQLVGRITIELFGRRKACQFKSGRGHHS